MSDVPGDLGISFPVLGHGEDPLTGYREVRVYPPRFLINSEACFNIVSRVRSTALGISCEIAHEIEHAR